MNWYKMSNVNLDEAVATRVMGWTLRDYRIGPDGGTYDGGNLGRGIGLRWIEGGILKRIEVSTDLYETPTSYLYAPFAPASDITAAWFVVERLRSEPWRYDVNLLGAGLEGSWWCYIRTLAHSRTVAEATEPTVCRAICVAALAAIAKGEW